MRFEVTEKGVYDAKGKMIEKGAVIVVDGDEIPASLLNKGRVVTTAKREGKTPVVNPQKSDARLELEKQADELKVEFEPGMSDDALKALVDAALAK